MLLVEISLTLSIAIQNLIININMINIRFFFINNTFVQLVFFGIPMGTNCVPLLSDLFLHAYDADFRPSFH